MLPHMHCYEKFRQGNLITTLQPPVASPQDRSLLVACSMVPLVKKDLAFQNIASQATSPASVSQHTSSCRCNLMGTDTACLYLPV